MNITTLPNRTADDAVALERLAGNATLTDREKIAEVSRQFEAVLLRQILAETQKPVITSKFSDNSTAANIYRDMISNQLADSISQSGAVGLGKNLEQQLNRQLVPAGHPSVIQSPQPAVQSDAAGKGLKTQDSRLKTQD